ncbi:YbaB/EbfC family nucleoid-associated protein [Micromonospora sp. CPM1]|uniref:YbaB/EbfC family nucleoid-associated protein n=1 Tax=Micromonospora sp. CPM1 TaxID=2944809 RepID=UPI00207C6856|nr:YbaB/EbfC family nucleoid-associated protein [Micromonospora sp. CPM1]MCO1613345.1 YbaB/EbfC family nucleoid-associated protein [Micromonospora sp. CPM1]
MQPESTPIPPSFQEFMENAQRLEDQMRNAQSELERAIVTGRSQDATVVVMASGLGKVQAVRVDPRVYDQRDAVSLQTAVMEAIQAAAANAGKLATEKMGPVEINLH